ncbi:histone-lysine N-methyltransferase ATX2-like protein isoform X1, partial [Tanacetum coccineum]
MNLITEYIDLALLVRLGNESYFGRIAKYDSESHRHYVEYEDGDEELVTLSKERIKFHVSLKEMKCLRLTCDLHCSETDDLDVNKMIVLTANLDDCHDIELGDIIWAKLTGHAVWPAIVRDESFLSIRRGLSKISREKSMLVQFFGTHDFASDNIVISTAVSTDLEDDGKKDKGSGDSKKTCLSTELVETKFKGTKSDPFIVGDLEVLKLGKMVKDLNCVNDEGSIWPLGYKGYKEVSFIISLFSFGGHPDPSVCSAYKMEVLRDTATQTRPLFRVTTNNGDHYDGADPLACWNIIYKKIRQMHSSISDNSQAEAASESFFKSGADMFGFSDPHVLRLIQ